MSKPRDPNQPTKPTTPTWAAALDRDADYASPDRYGRLWIAAKGHAPKLLTPTVLATVIALAKDDPTFVDAVLGAVAIKQAVREAGDAAAKAARQKAEAKARTKLQAKG